MFNRVLLIDDYCEDSSDERKRETIIVGKNFCLLFLMNKTMSVLREKIISRAEWENVVTSIFFPSDENVTGLNRFEVINILFLR